MNFRGTNLAMFTAFLPETRLRMLLGSARRMPKWIVEHWERFDGACVKTLGQTVQPR